MTRLVYRTALLALALAAGAATSNVEAGYRERLYPYIGYPRLNHFVADYGYHGVPGGCGVAHCAPAACYGYAPLYYHFNIDWCHYHPTIYSKPPVGPPTAPPGATMEATPSEEVAPAPDALPAPMSTKRPAIAKPISTQSPAPAAPVRRGQGLILHSSRKAK